MGERKPLASGLAVVPPDVDIEAVRRFVKQDGKLPSAPAERSETNTRSADETVFQTNPTVGQRRGVIAVGLIPVTVRLKPAIASALKRASLERQLAGAEPYTQQDIVEQALVPWLRENGFEE